MEAEFLKLIMLFSIYSILGWAMESIYVSILQKRLVNTGFLYGPFCPIYGFGAVLLYLTLDSFKGNIFITFGIGFIMLTIWEYMVGLIMEKLFNTKYWDYSNNKFNIKGRVCLLNSIYWGILSVVFIEIVNPMIEFAISKVPEPISRDILIVILVILFIDIIATVIKTNKLQEGLQEIQKISDKIKENMLKLKDANSKNQEASINKLIDDLKLKQRIIKFKIDKQIIKLKRSFPTLKSEAIGKYVKEKVKNIRKEPKE